MDFFEAQDQAHRKSGRLVGMLIAGLMAMTVAVYAAVMLIIHLGGGYFREQDAQAARAGRRVYEGALSDGSSRKPSGGTGVLHWRFLRSC